MASLIPAPQPFVLDAGTAVSIGIAFSCMPIAQLLSSTALPNSTSSKYRALFIWHAYDFLTHFMVEAFYLYHCFFSYIELPIPTSDFPHPASLGLEHVPHLYGRSDRRYGPFYSKSWSGRMWQEYAKADRRWGSADLTVISIEILTCGVCAPLEIFVCWQIAQYVKSKTNSAGAQYQSRIWFVAISVAVAELYGGFMTFSPEWLSGNTNLDVSSPIYLWLYLVFFNVLWVFIPLWVLYAGYGEFSNAFAASSNLSKKTK